ncbi:MAG TPA: VOC family protein [Alphaproteobacteria bacterium]
MKPVAAYVTITDMQRSIAFYNRLWNTQPAHTDTRYSYYDLDGFSFGLFDPAGDGETTVTGNNSVLCFKVDELAVAYDHIRQHASTIDPILETQHVRLFQFTDPDGNRLEVFQEK